jgi:hypothetical protein
MAISKTEKLQRIHELALTEFDRVQAAQRTERLQCLQDRRFYSIAGAQWEGPLGEQFENKPRFEFNKVHLSVMRIISEYRNNRVTVDFTPKDGESRADLADVCDGLYRADEQDSGAQEAYDNAFEEAVGGGFGAWRLKACYEDDEDDDNDRQRIRIEPIFDADSSVFFDLDAKRQDKSDATKCWVLWSMTHESFEEQFGHSPTSWPKSVHQREFDWCTPDVVYVAEHYRIEETTEIVRVFRGLDDEDMFVPQHEFDEDETKEETLRATGFREVRRKRVKVKRVHKYIMSGLKVESDEGLIAGKCIPIVPVYGKRWYVDNIERCMGHVRLAKDAQRLENSLLSWLTEMTARFDIEKPILTPEQIQGHATMWAEDNVQRYPYLLINPMTDANGNPVATAPVAYTRAPNVPPAMAALIQVATQALDDLLGNQQAGEQLQPNLSGKAVELVQNRLDMQTFIYMSNFAKAMKRCGEIWLSMAKELICEDSRRMKTIGTDGAVDNAVMNRPMIDEDTDEQYLENDITEAAFDVWPDVGPSSSSKRSATVRALTSMAQMTSDPNDTQVLTAAAIMNLEGEGLQDIRQYFRAKLVRLGVVKPTSDEIEEMQKEQANQKPDPQSQYLLAAADQAAADASKKRADTVDTIAAADLKRAQTLKTLNDAHVDSHNAQLASLTALQNMLAGQGMEQPRQGIEALPMPTQQIPQPPGL